MDSDLVDDAILEFSGFSDDFEEEDIDIDIDWDFDDDDEWDFDFDDDDEIEDRGPCYVPTDDSWDGHSDWDH